MNDMYEELMVSADEMEDQKLFEKEVIKGDNDLLLMDSLLREAFKH